jgi:hypothetical protein
VAKWAGTGACALILAIWALSYSQKARTRKALGQWYVTTYQGDAGVFWWRPPPPLPPDCPISQSGDHEFIAEILCELTFAGSERWPPTIVSDTWGYGVVFSVWVVAALLGVPTAALWIIDRRRVPPGHCPCGYNLTGNVSGVCPECGAAVAGRARPTGEEPVP